MPDIGRLSQRFQFQNGPFSELTKHNPKLLWSAFLNSFGVRFGVRLYDRILKVSRTIADLTGAECIAGPHIREASQ